MSRLMAFAGADSPMSVDAVVPEWLSDPLPF